MGNIIGSNPQKWAKNQVNLRQQLLGLKDRDANVLSWINTSTAWIRAASPIHISEEKSIELTKTAQYAGRALAQEFVLFNGTSNIKETATDQPLIFTDVKPKLIANQKAGIANTNSIINSNVYGFGGIGNNGIVPMPGVQSLNINTYNRGSLRKAELKLKAFNKEQFAILDALYMRPGYTILIEWGHTSYFKGEPGTKDQNYKYEKANFDTTPFNVLMNQDLSVQPSTTQDDLLYSITKERQKSEGNYDGFFGKVTNFVWKFNTDGTYDITVKAISVGDVIESLTINRTLPTFNPPKEKKQKIVTANTKPDTTKYYIMKMEGGINPNAKNGRDFEVRVKDEDKYFYKEYWFHSINEGWKCLWGEPEFNYDTATEEERQVRYMFGQLSSTNWSRRANFSSQGQTSGAYMEKRKKLGGGVDALTNFTLKPPPDKIAEPTSVGPDNLLVNREKSDFNKWLYDIYNNLKNNVPRRANKNTTSSGKNKVKVSTLEEGDTRFVMVNATTLVAVTDGGTGDEKGFMKVEAKNSPFQYITLGTLLEYIQNTLLMYDMDENPFINIDFSSGNYCYTYPEQMSADPRVCVIPFRTRDSKDPEKIGGVYWEEILGTAFKTSSDFVGNLMEIHVNIHFIAATLDQSTKNNAVALLPFLEKLLYGIQGALGSVNKFSVIYDHDENTIKISDDVPLDPAIVGTKVPEEQRTLLNVYGWKPKEQAGSFVRNVGIDATLSNAFATMISIGAQSRSTSDITNATAFSRWNSGLQDVINPSKLSKAVIERDKENTKAPTEIFKDNIASLKKAGNVVADFYYRGKQPTKDAISSTMSLNAELGKFLGTYYNKDNNVPSIQGFIPFNMSLDMDGFSGLRIYEKFYITTEILPPSYPENLSFIIKGLRHKVDSAGWQTSIESLSVQSSDGKDVLQTPKNVIADPD